MKRGLTSPWYVMNVFNYPNIEILKTSANLKFHQMLHLMIYHYRRILQIQLQFKESNGGNQHWNILDFLLCQATLIIIDNMQVEAIIIVMKNDTN